MARWEVPLADFTIEPNELEAIAETYRSGWLSMGPQTEALEDEFARFAEAQHAVAVSSGTAALHLICLAAGLKPGDEVVVPSLTFVATVNAIAYTGARPVFADIAGLTRPWLSEATIEAVRSPRTKAVMNVAYGGHAGETLAISHLAQRHGLTMLEDAAHAIGAEANGKKVGTLGLAGAYSFFSNKNLPVGEGGMVVTNDLQVAEQCRLLRSHGMSSMTWDRHRGHAASYDVLALGFNYRIDEPRATLARERLKRLDRDNRRRQELDVRYRHALEKVNGVEPTLPPASPHRSSYHLFTAVLDEDVDRDEFRSALANCGIQTSVHYPPVHQFSIYESERADLPLTEAYARRGVTFPLFADMSAGQQDLVVRTVAGFLTAR